MSMINVHCEWVTQPHENHKYDVQRPTIKVKISTTLNIFYQCHLHEIKLSLPNTHPPIALGFLHSRCETQVWEGIIIGPIVDPSPLQQYKRHDKIYQVRNTNLHLILMYVSLPVHILSIAFILPSDLKPCGSDIRMQILQQMIIDTFSMHMQLRKNV
jgi:hypothetical protein